MPRIQAEIRGPTPGHETPAREPDAHLPLLCIGCGALIARTDDEPDWLASWVLHDCWHELIALH
jgi:hypothetical protein